MGNLKTEYTLDEIHDLLDAEKTPWSMFESNSVRVVAFLLRTTEQLLSKVEEQERELSVLRGDKRDGS